MFSTFSCHPLYAILLDSNITLDTCTDHKVLCAAPGTMVALKQAKGQLDADKRPSQVLDAAVAAVAEHLEKAEKLKSEDAAAQAKQQEEAAAAAAEAGSKSAPAAPAAPEPTSGTQAVQAKAAPPAGGRQLPKL